MSGKLVGIEINNFRCLAKLSVETKPLNVLFGPNGAGKSTFLDTLWLIRDCAIRGVDVASSDRDHGIGMLWDGAEDNAKIAIAIETESARYEVSLGYSSGRIEAFVGETLISKKTNEILFERSIGNNVVRLGSPSTPQNQRPMRLREPTKLALTTYTSLETSDPAAAEVDNLLRLVRHYNARSASLFKIKRFGSESDYSDRLQDRCENLWSVLRNIHGRQAIDDRYQTIVGFMRESFPAFKDIFFEPTGRTSIYANFLDKNRQKPIQASGVSDGHLQMLINLTALFSEGADCPSLILFDEPEISLHPWALAVFAKAVKLATEKWNKQVFIATHSPVLISQFEPENIIAAEIDDRGQTALKRVSEIPEIQDLLEEYATGSLYMAEAIAPQSKESVGGVAVNER